MRIESFERIGGLSGVSCAEEEVQSLVLWSSEEELVDQATTGRETEATVRQLACMNMQSAQCLSYLLAPVMSIVTVVCSSAIV